MLTENGQIQNFHRIRIVGFDCAAEILHPLDYRVGYNSPPPGFGMPPVLCACPTCALDNTRGPFIGQKVAIHVHGMLWRCVLVQIEDLEFGKYVLDALSRSLPIN